MSSVPEIAADICVIGGGPAGSTIAHRLASLQHNVCLVEARASPGNHIGASVSAEILPLLECIGVREKVESSGFPRLERTVLWWSETVPIIKSDPGAPGFLVDRSRFDPLLLQNARGNGVTVLEPARAGRPQRVPGGWRIGIDHQGESKQVVSRFVVDASGGTNLLKGRRIRNSSPLLAMYAHWVCASWPEDESRVEAGKDEWFWCAPLGGGKTVAAVFVDPKRFAGVDREGVARSYHDILHQFRLFPTSSSARIEGEVRVCDASSRYVENAVGDDFIRVGDANLTLDPLSSQGVYSAIASGLQAAVVVNTLISCPENAALATEFYGTRQIEKNQQHAIKTAHFYSERAAVCDRPFWRQRAIGANRPTTPSRDAVALDQDSRIQLSESIRVEHIPVIHGDIVTSAPALHHQSLDRPVAFVGGIEIIPLLSQIRSGQSVRDVVQCWSRLIPAELSRRLIDWLWSRRLIVLHSGAGPTEGHERSE